MEKKKVLVFLGQEDSETLSGFLADSYEQGAKDAGHEVKRINIGDLKFDPLLHKGYKEIQELEPDLIRVQEEMKWADHVALFIPIGGVPCLRYSKACLIGCFFRALLSSSTRIRGGGIGS